MRGERVSLKGENEREGYRKSVRGIVWERESEAGRESDTRRE